MIKVEMTAMDFARNNRILRQKPAQNHPPLYEKECGWSVRTLFFADGLSIGNRILRQKPAQNHPPLYEKECGWSIRTFFSADGLSIVQNPFVQRLKSRCSPSASIPLR